MVTLEDARRVIAAAERKAKELGQPMNIAVADAGARAAIASFRSNNVPGDPEATGPAILKVVDSQDPPLRIFFGSGGLPMTRTEYARRIATWEKWNDLSLEAQGDWAAKQSR